MGYANKERAKVFGTDQRNGKSGEPLPNLVRHGPVDWLFREYKQTKAYLEKVSERSRPDYERTMLLVTDILEKKGDRIGDRKIKAITTVSADKIYELVVSGPCGPRPQTCRAMCAHGPWCIAFIPMRLTAMFRTRGAE